MAVGFDGEPVWGGFRWTKEEMAIAPVTACNETPSRWRVSFAPAMGAPEASCKTPCQMAVAAGGWAGRTPANSNTDINRKNMFAREMGFGRRIPHIEFKMIFTDARPLR